MNLNLICLTIFAVSCCYAADYISVQPDYVLPCQIKDPQFVKCSTPAVQKLFGQLAKGIPNVLKTIDPMNIKKIQLRQTGTESANLNVDLSNVIVKGFGHVTVTENQVSDKDYSWITKFTVPSVRMDGDYQLDGRILLLQLKGSGKFFLDIENLDIVMYTKTKLYEKGDFTFYNITNIKIEVFPKKVRTRFDNLFNGNKELEDSTNQLFNDSWQDFFEALKPTITESIESIFLTVLRKVFHYIPANFFVTDIPKSTELYG